MTQRRWLATLFALFVLASAATVRAQSGVRPKPSPSPEDEERVFTEEVRVPVFAYDDKGRFDPTLGVDDVLVVEDDTPQQVKSVQRIPASVLLVLGTGSEWNPAVRTQTTREIALNVLSNLRDGDSVAAIQFNSAVSVVQAWTTDREEAARLLRSRLELGRGSRLTQALTRAAEMFEGLPVGNRHLILVTDGVDSGRVIDYKDLLLTVGVESAQERAQIAEATRRLIATQATVHVISYAAAAKKRMRERERPKEAPGAAQSRQDIASVGIDPTLPPGMSRGGPSAPRVNSGIRIDPTLKKVNRAYERAMKKGEDRLKALTDETGGSLILPATDEEMVAKGAEVAREIYAQYVVTYRPKRPLATSPATEYRRLRVHARRVGLTLRARRGYVVGVMR
ncbi:MAG TPA: VWA domain-containing protein [Pyrinomonadaceae bacterium]|nr:VWA domain-containing protein [Pyrinomonadaceae bacterium]